MSPKYAKPPDESDLARLMVVRVTLPNGEPYEFNLHDVAWIEWDDLHAAIAGQPQRYAFYAMLHVEVRDQHRLALRAARDRFGERSDHHREVMSTVGERGGVKPPTETAVKQAVEAEPEQRKLQDVVDRLESLEARVGVVRECLTQRRDMLTAASMLRAPEASPKAEDRAAYRMRK